MLEHIAEASKINAGAGKYFPIDVRSINNPILIITNNIARSPKALSESLTRNFPRVVNIVVQFNTNFIC